MSAQVEGAIGEYLLTPDARCAEFLDPGVLRRLIEAHASGRDRTHTQLLLAVLMLEVWLTTFLPRATASATHTPRADVVRVPA